MVVVSAWPKEEEKPQEFGEIVWLHQQEFEFKQEDVQPLLQPAQPSFDFQHYFLSLVIRQGDGPCPLTSDPKRFRVKINRDVRQDQTTGVTQGDQGCPNCGAKEGLFFIGSQAATLSSVAIDELFGSVLNDDPKLLAFTDSVQDASHRAGFF